MKKLIILVAVVSLGFVSCKEKCKDCTSTSSIDGVDQPNATMESEYCGDQLDAIDGKTTTIAGIKTTVECE
jgi:hypothetical protein